MGELYTSSQFSLLHYIPPKHEQEFSAMQHESQCFVLKNKASLMEI